MNILDEIIERIELINYRIEALEAKQAEKLLSIKEAADILKINPQTLYGKVRKGLIKPIKFGGKLRIRLKDINEFKSNV